MDQMQIFYTIISLCLIIITVATIAIAYFVIRVLKAIEKTIATFSATKALVQGMSLAGKYKAFDLAISIIKSFISKRR